MGVRYLKDRDWWTIKDVLWPTKSPIEGVNWPDKYLTRNPDEYHRDSDKPAVGLIPPDFILGMGEVLRFGNDKYGPRNWERHADSWNWTQLYASCMRHLLQWANREDDDPESGMKHLYHAACNLAMLSELCRVGRGTDDRSKL